MADTDDNDDQVLVHFLESEILLDGPPAHGDGEESAAPVESMRALKRPWVDEAEGRSSWAPPRPIESGIFGKTPPLR
ncbi:hypothetical protein J5N97_029908 [Dioscorea zingiberensis]|uniref:Uncharacterized protein n=1 Tax=Dioscorea zingiberensis TaxID=325984 RepID=A0A9D5BWT2_9LILI|nr:hypothetical protein J5N97_029908 [Dioscorea zingiberensis]